MVVQGINVVYDDLKWLASYQQGGNVVQYGKGNQLLIIGALVRAQQAEPNSS